ncbi:MAG: hypothetical protein ACYS0C_06355 [Planctomycetota bacterium]|jgi:hypothetical protein
MENEKIKKLCMSLLRADSEDEVVSILRKAGYWDNQELWRLYGDKEGNFAQVGNQSSFPEAALVEKVVNSIDARLMSECLSRGIDPESDNAPRSLRDAIARFYEDREAKDDGVGTLANWPKAKRTEQSRFITIAATGGRPIRGQRPKHMCLTITDQGEGQSAKRLPHTILSLNDKNKQRIRFVQGKFNMGGSGALRFCGNHGLQLVITRRDPILAVVEGLEDSSADEWAMTVIRREEPSNKSGEPIHSEFTYLAPLSAGEKPRRGEVLRFKSKRLKLMPHQDKAYAREIEWGTGIKLYEYETNVGQSNVLRKDGLLYALERLMPEIPLPVRVHECRKGYGGKEGSYETPIAGLVVRLIDGKGDNLEPSFPLTVQLRAGGMNMKARIYAFKEDKASTYLKDEGVIFAINGQAHGYLPKSIFSRTKAVGLPRLRDSLLVLIDCSSLSARQREDLFMSSRDRLSKKPIRYEVELEIEQMLSENPELKRLQQQRREQDVESKLSEERPLEEVLGKVLKASPTLKTLFLRGQRLAKPFTNGAGGRKGGGGGSVEGNGEFKGKRHPSFFRIKDVPYGEVYKRNCEEGRRCRIKFKTDVENEYFERSRDKGKFDLDIIECSCEMSPPSYSLVLEDGEAFLNMALPEEAEVDDWFTVQTTVNDSTLLDPFVNVIKLNVLSKMIHKGGGKGSKKKRKGGGRGNNKSSQGIKLPKVEPVRQDDKHWSKYKFTMETACHVISDPVELDGKMQLEHVFYINMDNNSLGTEMKYSRQDPRLLEAKFKYGNVLLGLAMLHQAENNKELNSEASNNDGSEQADTIQDQIRQVSKAVAPVLLPMIDQLAGLNEDDIEVFSMIGEDA